MLRDVISKTGRAIRAARVVTQRTMNSVLRDTRRLGNSVASTVLNPPRKYDPIGNVLLRSATLSAGPSRRLAGTAFGTVAKTAAMTTLAVGGFAATMAMGAAYVGARAADTVAAVGGRNLRYEKLNIPYTNKAVNVPHRFSRAFQEAMVGGAGIYGMGAGAIDYARKNQWNLNQAISTGAIEVEREDFLGATGSLTIASYKNRNGRQQAASGPGVDTSTILRAVL